MSPECGNPITSHSSFTLWPIYLGHCEVLTLSRDLFLLTATASAGCSSQ